MSAVGKSEAIEAYEPIGKTDKRFQSIEAYNSAFDLLDINPEMAQESFSNLNEDNPEDKLVLLHLNRLKNEKKVVR